MSIGYACVVVGELDCKISNCALKTATPEKLEEISLRNLLALERMIDYNIKHQIRLFRISSDIIPFASHSINNLDWMNIFKEQIDCIGDKIKKDSMRVSTHPGQYTVLNSPEERVVAHAIDDLSYHAKFMDALQLDSNHKIILHIGGIYGEKQVAVDRFFKNYQNLPKTVKTRLVIENDDRSYNVEDVLGISYISGIPVVFDNLHHKVNPPITYKPEKEWIIECSKTWKEKDGIPKIHYSQSKSDQTPRSHSSTINSKEFYRFFQSVEEFPLDIMLEVKDKNLSAIKCIGLTNKNHSHKRIEEEWAHYKYYVLSKSASLYNGIREVLKEKEKHNGNRNHHINETALRFYEIVEKSLLLEEDKGAQINAAQHIWGYMKKTCTAKEKLHFQKLLKDYENGSKTIKPIKTFLFNESVNQSIQYLLESYYFYI